MKFGHEFLVKEFNVLILHGQLELNYSFPEIWS